MAWYSNHMDQTKKLDQIIDQNPTLEQLLNYPQFLGQLRAFNPKLLDFLTNSHTITEQLISYISVPPEEIDCDERKYKLPAMAIGMVQSEAISIINSFFKESPKSRKKFINMLFEQQFSQSNKVEGQILPILAGYFLRVNICLLNNKYHEAIDVMYENMQNFELLLQNTYNLSITNALQVYLNLDLTKNSQVSTERLNVKLNVINKIIRIIEDSVQGKSWENNIKSWESSIKKESSRVSNDFYLNTLRVENLSSVLIELFQKYYLIADGKQMVDQVLYNEQNIRILFKGLLSRTEISFSIINILISIVKFYSLSSFNNDEWNNPEQRKKNEEKLQTQPAVLLLLDILPNLINEITKFKQFTIFQAKIVQLVNITITLNSHKIFNVLKNQKYFHILIDLLFTNQKISILGTMIEKLFLLIFRTQRIINQEIKHYIFCEANIIDITAGRYLIQFINDQQVSASMACIYRRKGYFGHLMKIMKIYSGIQTTDDDIINAIKSKSDIWNKISRLILKPYESFANKQLSTYDIPESLPLEFTVKTIIGSNFSAFIKEADNTKLIDQINREEAIQNLKTLQNSIENNKLQAQIIIASHKESYQTKENNDSFFDDPVANNREKYLLPLESKESDNQNQFTSSEGLPTSPGLQKKPASYNDFIQQQKVKVETQIQRERSKSKQRALSKGKTRITSPSPTKRVNKWSQNLDQKSEQNLPKQKQKVSLTSNIRSPKQTLKNLPKIPIGKKGINISSTSMQSKDQMINKSIQLQKKQLQQGEYSKNKSIPNLDILKQVKILYRIDPPGKKEFRKITQEDKAIFDSLGIAYS